MWYFEPKKNARYRYDYVAITEWLNENIETNEIAAKKELYARGKTDLFFLMYFFLDIRKINHEWLVDKIYEVDDDDDRVMDLWSRETWKSTIKSYGKPIKFIINDPETRIGLFSNTRDLAKDFLRRIKTTLETNELLKRVYSDIFYQKPERESPKWSENDGLLVRRKGTFAEMTVEAWGVTDGMPVGRHFPIRIYDDLVTWDTARTADQINKTKEGFGISSALGTTDGIAMIQGTPYDYNDLYADIEKGKFGKWKVRKYAADVQPSLWTDEQIEQKRGEYANPYQFSCQISLKPIPEDRQKLLYDWLEWHDGNYPETNDYIVVDPAGEKKANSTYTVMWHVGVDAYRRFYIKNIVRDKLNNKEKWENLVRMVGQCSTPPKVGYEKYSMQTDIFYIQEKQQEKKIYFEIIPLGGNVKKEDRIRGSLIPLLVDHRLVFPRKYLYTDVEGKSRDLIKEFLDEEYLHFPNTTWKDMLDCLARITEPDLGITYPNIKKKETDNKKTDWARFLIRSHSTRSRWAGR